MTLGWLHLSDLHFLDQAAWRDGRVLRELLADVAAQRAQGLRLDFILCTGDIGFGTLGDESLAQQYQHAANFFTDLLACCELPAQRLFIVPGNHDIDRGKVLKSHTEYLRNKKRTVAEINQHCHKQDAEWQAFMQRLAQYQEFIREICPHIKLDANAAFSSSLEIEGMKISIAGLNSAWSCADDQDKNALWLAGKTQLENHHKALQGQVFDLRLGMLHHPLDWLQETEKAELNGLLEKDFDLLLHGHEHASWVTHTSTLSLSHTRIAAGALTAESSDEFGYNLVQLHAKGMQVHLRKYDGKGGGWVEENVAGRTTGGVWEVPLLGKLAAFYQPGNTKPKKASAANGKRGKAKTVQPDAGEVPVKINQQFYLPQISLTEHFNDPRQQLEKLRAQLLATRSSAVLAGAKAALHGMGGVGKTQLALQYCHRYKNEYEGVWWLQAETMESLAQDCVLFCGKQGLPLAPGQAPWSTMNAWLAQQRNWLLVYDNAENAQALQAVLPSTETGHHLLITSRLPRWQGMQTMALDVWQDEEALPFLQQRLPNVAEADLLALNQALGGLPLALEQACAYLNNTGLAIASYLKRLQEPLRAWEMLDKTDSQYCSRSVLATLTLAYEKLSPAAQTLLGICAWLGPEPIPEYLFTEESEDFPDKLPPALRAIATDEITWRETVAELHNYALCQSKPSISSDHMGNRKQSIACLHFHRLSQAALRSKEASQEWGRTALILLRAVFPYYAHYPENWPRCRMLLAHVYHLRDGYQTSWQEVLCLDWLLSQLALYLKHGPALYQQALALERASLAICQKELGDEHPDTLVTMNNLASSLRQLGDAAAARSLQEQVLAIRRRVLGEEHPSTLTTMANLANSLKQLGDAAAARSLEEQVLAIRRRVLGEEHPDTLTTMANLASSLAQLGDAAAAHSLEEQVLAIRRRVLGEEHPDTLTTMHNLASSLKQLGDAAAARSLEEQVLAIRRRVLGEEHPDTLNSMNNLAISLYYLADYPAAQALMEHALLGRNRILGEEHPYTLSSKKSLAAIIAAQASGQGENP